MAFAKVAWGGESTTLDQGAAGVLHVESTPEPYILFHFQG
jgi:hypothetical protein